jgi:hypothetical protein
LFPAGGWGGSGGWGPGPGSPHSSPSQGGGTGSPQFSSQGGITVLLQAAISSKEKHIPRIRFMQKLLLKIKYVYLIYIFLLEYGYFFKFL